MAESKENCLICNKKKPISYPLIREVLGRNINTIIGKICDIQIRDAASHIVCNDCAAQLVHTQWIMDKVEKALKQVPKEEKQPMPVLGRRKSVSGLLVASEGPPPRKFSRATQTYDGPTIRSEKDESTGKYTFYCDTCSYENERLAIFKLHLKRKHNQEVPKPFACAKCLETFSAASYYHRHICRLAENFSKSEWIRQNFDKTEPVKVAKTPTKRARAKSLDANLFKEMSASENSKEVSKETKITKWLKPKTPNGNEGGNSQEQNESAGENFIVPEKPKKNKKIGNKRFRSDTYISSDTDAVVVESPKKKRAKDIANESSLESPRDRKNSDNSLSSTLKELSSETSPKKDKKRKHLSSTTLEEERDLVSQNKKNKKKNKQQNGEGIADISLTTEDAVSLNSHSQHNHPKSKDDWEFQCDMCTFISANSKEFKDHLLAEHDVHKTKIYKCSFCDAAFKRYNTLNEHMHDFHEDEI